MYCENCGLQIFPEKQECTRCGAVPSQQFVQLMALAILLVTIIANTVTGWILLPKVAAAHPHALLFRAWLWSDQLSAKYGWIPLAAGLMVAMVLTWAACGGTAVSPVSSSPFATPAGTYTLTVTGTYTATGSSAQIVHNTTLTLTVH